MFFGTHTEKVQEFLKSIGTEAYPHVKNQSLYNHLVRVGVLLKGWGLKNEVVLAGQCHSLYSTERFDSIIISVTDRQKLRDEIGEVAEALVFLFCSMKRDTFQRDIDGTYFFHTHTGNVRTKVSDTQAEALIHILLANDVDHLTDLTVYQVGRHIARFYAPWKELLAPPARKIVEDFELPMGEYSDAHTNEYVRFIAHAGVQVKSRQLSLLIDPWLYPSTREKPRMQGFEPTNFTIDFLIPEPRNTIEELNPDIILLSHFHTHHAPLEEIRESASRKPITIVCPPIKEERLAHIRKTLGEKMFETIRFRFIREDETFTEGDITVRAMYHNRFGHIAYLVTTENGSIFHLSDPVASMSRSLEFDPVWDKFNNLNPDYAFISCAGHAHRKVHDDGTRAIDENETFTPTQAAKFAVKIGARAAGAVGIFNHSVWTDRVEFSRSPGEAESELHWALSFLSPRTRVLTLRPGDVFPLRK